MRLDEEGAECPSKRSNECLHGNRVLDGARRNAAEYGYAGARYPWKGDVHSIDQCPNWQYRDHEVHVTADVVYGLAHYARSSGDSTYLSGDGGDVVRETARYWLDRVDWRPRDGYPSLLGVMGPDEYTPISSNNAYTNRLVSFAMALAAAIEPDKHLRTRYAEIASALPILRRADGLVLQCEEFERLAPIDLDLLWKDRSRPLASQVSQERLYRSQCLKQADVLLLMALFPHEFSDDDVRQCWEYYLPRTTHDSSPSPAVHALIALRLGLMQETLRFWQQSTAIDMGNGAEVGIHIAAAGLNWQVAVFGFGGLSTAMNSDVLNLSPRLPPAWTRLAFLVKWKGQPLRVEIQAGQFRATNESQAPLNAQIGQSELRIPAAASQSFDLLD